MVYDIFHVLFIKVRTVICDYITHKTFQPEQNLRPRLWTFDEIRKQRISVSLGRVHLHLSQKDAAVEAVRNIGLNQVRQVEHTIFSEHPAWKATFEERLRVLRNAM